MTDAEKLAAIRAILDNGFPLLPFVKAGEGVEGVARYCANLLDQIEEVLEK